MPVAIAGSDARALDARAGEVADMLALMANAHRLRILCRLAEGEASVGMLIEEVGLSQSALSQHLARLRAGGLVTTRRAAQTIFYSLASAETQAIMAALYEVFCGPERAASLEREQAGG
ncbi:metalloregulator ArsR/SmtB family transcription factor [Aurantimonas aggregata]|uniref:Metalloregulator ArsR/SmtB family transcription factor n=1 Tax=Aurantimonas aggregata TaxID=2047720 RepID=A0A6L9MCD3_9HYPH|nr:metalloregulator ArsR/SmtB family transcription factor [Aurantimonas aggregata]NDV85463.1 metalloregulator ArsR/SmtB family transcription factor [Aurantimonas aggregata]